MALTQTALSVRIAALASMAGLALSISGCDTWSNLTGGGNKGEPEVVAPSQYAPCLESYGRGVSSVASTADGKRDFYISNELPSNVNKDAWTSSSRAVYELDVATQRLRPLASTWDSEFTIAAYATLDPARPTPVREIRIAEKIEQLQVSADGNRIVIGVSRKDLTGGLSTLYYGAVPPGGAASLRPGEGGGLAPIKVNDDVNDEAIQGFSLAPDGKSVAAIVGDMGEVRVFDIDAGQVRVYSLGKENAITVTNDLPVPLLNIGVDRQPAITANGAQLVWSPDSAHIAYATPVGVGGWAVQILDPATGKPTLIHRFEDTTQPQSAWAQDGQSLYIATTETSGTETFGNTSIRRYTAAKDGKTIGGVGLIERPVNLRTVPAFLTLVGDDVLLFNWEKQLFRFTIKEGDLGKATFRPLTERYPAKVGVLAQPIFGATAADRAVFMINDPAVGNRMGVYSHLTAENCPAPTAKK
ncbi:MAG: hypothetical protein ABI780_04490 [Ardenticatenales bacterium]